MEVLEALLGGPFSTICVTLILGNSKGFVLSSELLADRAAGEYGSRGASRSRCYRFGSAGGFLDSCQSPGSVSFRQPIRGVVTERSPSLIPRSRHTSLEEIFSLLLLLVVILPRSDLDRKRRILASSKSVERKKVP